MDINGFIKRYKGLSPLSLKAYGTTLRQLEQYIGKDSSEPTDAQVRLFLQNIANASYLNRNKAAIRRYYAYTNREWPFDRMEFPRQRSKIPKFVSRDVVNSILEQAQDEHEYMVVKTLFMLGARMAEVMLLTPENLDESGGTLPGVRILGKRDKERVVPVADETFWKELKKYAAKFHDDERLFPWGYNDYYNLLRRMCQYAGVKPITPHQLRHSRAVDLQRKGMETNELQQFLGHEDPATTLIYLRVGSNEVGEALKRIGE